MKVKFLIAALFLSLVAAAQPSNYIKFNTRGRWIAGMFDSTLHVPRFNGSPSLRTGGSSMDGAIAIDTMNGIFYFYQGGSWKRANLDTSAYAVTSVYRKTASDSVFYVKGGVHTFAFKDSTGGGTPTLQQVLTAGSTLTTDHTIDFGGNDFILKGDSIIIKDPSGNERITFAPNGNPGEGDATRIRLINGDGAKMLIQTGDEYLETLSGWYVRNTVGYNAALSVNGSSLSGSTPQTAPLIEAIQGDETLFQVANDSIFFRPPLGRFLIDTLNYTLSTTGKKILIRDTVTGLVQNIDPSLLGASSYTFTNGLTESGGTVKLGGALTQNTSVTNASGYDLKLYIDEDDSGVGLVGINYNSLIGFEAGAILIQHGNYNYLSSDGTQFQLYGGNGNNTSSINLRNDSLKINPPYGILRIDTLVSAVGTKALRYNPTTGLVSYADTTSGGSTSPAGSDTHVQFNDGGSFGGDAGLNYNKTDNELKINTATDNGAYKLQGEGGMYWKLDGTNAFKIVHSVGADRVTINGSSGNLDSYTFSSQNFSTSSAGSSTFNGSYMRQSGGAYFQGWQQAFSMIRTYPGTGSSPQSTVIFDNTTETSPASDYQIATFKLSGTSVAFVDKDGKYNAQSTVTAGGTTGNQTINKPTGTVNIAAAGSTVTVTNSTCTANSIVYAVLRTNDATATGIKSVVPSAGSFVITLNAAATAEVSVGFIVFN